MLAVECCIKSNGFASLDADELFFINGGSGSYGGTLFQEVISHKQAME